MQAWVFQPWVKDVVDKRLRELEGAKKPTIGFHIRWGDKIEEDILFVRALSPVPVPPSGIWLARRSGMCVGRAETSNHTSKGLHRVLHQELP
jgi:hypothetical protein